MLVASSDEVDGSGSSVNRSSDSLVVSGDDRSTDEEGVDEVVGVRISRLEVVVVVSPEPEPPPPVLQVRPLRQQPVLRQYEPD